MINIKIDEIIIEDRVRKTHGDLDSLERSIKQLGVLQPIGITPIKQLIFGGRRLQACKNLGLEIIPAKVFNIDADDLINVLRMERDENDQRLDLTPSEKVEIARRIEDALAGRQGQRTDLNPEQLPQNFAEVKPGTESRDIAAKSVGWNRETYRQAKAVVDSGNRDEIQAMDTGEKSINATYNSIKNSVNTKSSNQEKSMPKTFKITFAKNPEDIAEKLIQKGGHEYCTKLAVFILEAAGHKVSGVIKLDKQ